MKRNLGILLTLACLALALFTGAHLRQSFSAEHDLRQQIADVSLANTAGPAPTGALATAEASLTTALKEVHHTTHTQELTLAIELLGLLAGILLLRPSQTSPR